jgi:hypothetical protein
VVSIWGPGKPYCKMPDGLTGETGMGTGAAADAGRGRAAEDVEVGGGCVLVVAGVGGCFGFELE